MKMLTPSIEKISATRPHRMSIVVGGVASLLFAGPVTAIESTVAENATPASKAPQQEKPELKKEVQKGEKQEDQAMIGLGGAPASKTLALQLNLPDGKGLTLFHVIPGSPADQVGIKPHDVMTSFDGKPIGSQQDLRQAIIPRHPGDKVEVEYFHKGKVIKKSITLGERPVHLGRMQAPGVQNRWMFEGLGAEIPEADMKRIELQMKQRVEALRKQLNKQGVLELNLKELQMNPPQNANGVGAAGFKVNANTSFTIKDADGSVTIKSANGKKVVVIRDQQGEVVFDGPYDTPQDKAALPDDFKDRVEKLKFSEKGAVFRFKMAPQQQNMAAPAPLRENENQGLE